MNLKDYSDWTDTVWTTSESHTRHEQLAIMALGLVGEAGEVTEIIKKALRGHYVGDLLVCDNVRRDSLKEELGDVFYYWVRMCRYFKIDPEQVLELNQQKLTLRYKK